MNNEELELTLKRVRFERQAARKRMYEQAKRARKASGTPMVERADLKSVQCEFESRAEDSNA